jgi:hypothetical protein
LRSLFTFALLDTGEVLDQTHEVKVRSVGSAFVHVTYRTAARRGVLCSRIEGSTCRGHDDPLCVAAGYSRTCATCGFSTVSESFGHPGYPLHDRVRDLVEIRHLRHVR